MKCSLKEINEYLGTLEVPKLSKKQISFCERDISEKDFYDWLKRMQNNKPPGNDGLWHLLQLY